jgi:predicted RNA-binding Zn-ribbon protein involved in translation (DUF1610 family)
MPDVSPVVSPVSSPRARRAYVPPDELWPLFRAIATYRVLTVPHAHALVLSSLDEGRVDRTTRKRVKTLVDRGFLGVFTVAGRPPIRFLHLLRPAFARWPALEAFATDHARKPPTPDLAIFAWHKAALAIAARAAGYEVGRDLGALTALRRSLIDRQTARAAKLSGRHRDDAELVLRSLRQLPYLQPWTTHACEGCGLELPIDTQAPRFCPECGSTFRRHAVSTPHQCDRCGVRAERTGPHTVSGSPCAGVLRHVDYLPFDLAWKRAADGFAVQVLFADNPYRATQTQLDELPLRVLGQPRIEVVVRPSDDGSVFDRSTKSYFVRGARLRSVLRAFSEQDARIDSFPFWTTAAVAPDATYPEAHFRVIQKEEP